MREVAHFRFDFVCKTEPINAVPTPMNRSWNNRLVRDFMVKFNYDREVVRAANATALN